MHAGRLCSGMAADGNDAFGKAMADFLAQPSEQEMLGHLPALVETYSAARLGAYKHEANKHKHRLVHMAVSKNYPRLLERLVAEYGFDVNAQRDSDQCTPMHLATWYRKREALDMLTQLGARVDIENSYGDKCDEKFAQIVESYSHIIWLDLELTEGFYENRYVEDGTRKKRILEVAFVITDKDLKEIARGEWTVGGFTKEDLDKLPEFHQLHFRDGEGGGDFPPRKRPRTAAPEAAADGGEAAEPDEHQYGNNLFRDMLKSSKDIAEVEKEVLKVLRSHCVERVCPIAGMSVQCDREVLREEMPAVYAFLNHRIIDVSSFLGMMDRWAPGKKREWAEDQHRNANYNHRAINDCEASIQAMRWMKDNFLQLDPNPDACE